MHEASSKNTSEIHIKKYAFVLMALSNTTLFLADHSLKALINSLRILFLFFVSQVSTTEGEGCRQGEVSVRITILR